jgi:hypothetical protein
MLDDLENELPFVSNGEPILINRRWICREMSCAKTGYLSFVLIVKKSKKAQDG